MTVLICFNCEVAVAMPGNKRWHFELGNKGIFIFRDGKISRFKKDVTYQWVL